MKQGAQKETFAYTWFFAYTMSFEKGTKTIQWEKNSLFNNWCWENWISTSKIMKLDPYIKSHTKINSKWIKYLNIRSKTIKLLEENLGQSFVTIVNNFLAMTPKSEIAKKKKIDKLNLKILKTKSTE